MDPELTAEDAKASMGNATFLQDQLLEQQGQEAMMQEAAPTDEELDMESDMGMIDEEGATTEDPEAMKEELKQEIMGELREELKDLLDDDTTEETENKESDTETN